MKNRLFRTFLLTLLVTAMLLGMFYLPRVQVGDWLMRRVNLLADVQERDSLGYILAELRADAREGLSKQVIDEEAVEVDPLLYADTVPEGMVAIEDFLNVEGTEREMDKFYGALDESGRRLVRVAYFGDSFVEGDILTSELRECLQGQYGGKGVGWVDIECVTAGFRTTVNHKSGGWRDHNANDGRGSGFRSDLQGVAGHYYLPAGTGTMTLTCQKRLDQAHLAWAEVATVFYTPADGLSVTASVNGQEARTLWGNGVMPAYQEPAYSTVLVPTDSVDADGDTLMREERRLVQPQGEVAASDTPSEWTTLRSDTLHGHIEGFTLKAHGPGRFYGVALDGRTGVAVDNFSMRGSNGWFIREIPTETLGQFASARPYDLIILHYGLNVASKNCTDYSYYTKRMVESVQHLQACYPMASILIVGVSDRDQRGHDGEMRTMPGIVELSRYQRRMASDCHVAFWNLYEAMGGEGSMVRMQADHEANLDYTHINFAGGRRLGRLFYDVLMNGKENYDRRHAEH